MAREASFKWRVVTEELNLCCASPHGVTTHGANEARNGDNSLGHAAAAHGRRGGCGFTDYARLKTLSYREVRRPTQHAGAASRRHSGRSDRSDGA
jgi:hypothetical protein